MGITIHAFFIFKAYTLSEIKGERMRTCLALDGTKPLHTIQRSCAVKGTTSCHPARCPGGKSSMQWHVSCLQEYNVLYSYYGIFKSIWGWSLWNLHGIHRKMG